ncbi:MAG: beta-lactamase family protein [Lachnospiraceae bacterium]|nr:beta-lactamase family protein [Lachnospiraceae bacterium]
MLYTKGEIECSPLDVEYDEKRLDVLNSHFQKLVDDNEIYCATYCLARYGKVFAHGAVGYKTYHKDPAVLVSPTDIHYIASMTKTFAAVAIMKLFEDGLLSLATKVGDILPQFNGPPFNGITIFHLLTHTSGMHPDRGCFPNDHNNGGYWHFVNMAYEAWKSKESSGFKEPFDWISAALSTGVRLEPDQQWMYSSFGFCILGEIIEKVTGIHSHQYLEDNILKPLGLTDTAFDLTPAMAKRYIIHGAEAEKDVADVLAGKAYQKDAPWDKIPSLGGGLVSTVWDAVRFGNMVLNNGTFDGVRILGRRAVEKMTDVAIKKPNYCWGSNEIRSYGIGFDHRNGNEFSFSAETVMHEGAGACALYIDPVEGLVASWIVPFVKPDWNAKAMYNTVNIIWSGLI